jgi:Electron transfer DM13
MLLSCLNGIVVRMCGVLLAAAIAACGGGGGGGGSVDGATSTGSAVTALTPTTPATTTTSTAPTTLSSPTTPAAPATPVTPGAPGTPATPTASGPDTAAACAKSNAKVGQVATLSMRSHGVSGKATVIDDCTIEIRNFSYDGGGLSKVFVYGGKAGNYVAGFPIGVNLRGTVFINQTLTVSLNPGDLDRLDGISIWCSDANANFGDGRFAPV